MVKKWLQLFGIIISQLIILWVAVANHSPAGYIVSGGDTVQIINWPKAIHDTSFVWSTSNSEGYFIGNYSYNLYYRFFYFISQVFHFSLSNQSILYMLIFLVGAFWALYLSTKIIHLGTEQNLGLIQILLSLVYTFNIYTLYNFTSTWGFSPFLFLYLLTPLIFSLAFKYFTRLDRATLKWILPLWAAVAFLSNIANGNMAYFVSLNILLLLFIILIYCLFQWGTSLLHYLKYLLVFYLVYLLAVSWSVYPQIQELFRISGSLLSTQAIFDPKIWVLNQAAHFSTVFFFSDPVYNFLQVRPLALLSGLIFLTVILLMSVTKRLPKMAVLFLTLSLICIFMLNKGIGLLNPGVIASIFSNPILQSLRSYDKTAIFMPFFILIICYGLLAWQSRPVKIIGSILLLASFLSVTPFLRGNVQKVNSASHLKGQDYLSSKYSSLVKIPDVYYSLANKVNQEKLISRVANFPYNALNSIGWVNYPVWKQLGSDPTVQLFQKPLIQAVSYATYGNWNYGDYWNKQPADRSSWLISLLGLSNSKYFLYHLDVDPQFIDQTKDKIEFLVSHNLISEVTRNGYFVMYKIADQYYLPHFYTPKKIIITDSTVNDLPTILSNPVIDNRQAIYLTGGNNLADSLATMPSSISRNPTIEYKEISPVKFRLRIHQASVSFPLIFSEAYHNSWQLFAEKPAVNIHTQTISNYKSYDGNADDQATVDELQKYLNQGLVSGLNQNGELGFVSKDIKDTIQNDNLPNGSILETWFKKTLGSEAKHLPVNGYANSWLINTDNYCAENSCKKNADGTFDLEIVAEYSSQKLYYIFGLVSLLTLVGAVVGYTLVARWRKKLKLNLF